MTKNIDIEIDKGSIWSIGIVMIQPTGIPLDLTGFTGKCQIRRYKTGAESIIADVLVTIDPDPRTGKVSLFLDDTITEKFKFKIAYYDLELTDSFEFTRRVLKGKVFLDQEVTI